MAIPHFNSSLILNRKVHTQNTMRSFTVINHIFSWSPMTEGDGLCSRGAVNRFIIVQGTSAGEETFRRTMLPVRNCNGHRTWWRQQMETFSALLAICAGNSPVPGELPAQRPVTRSFDVFFDLRPNKRLSKQWWGWWFETLSCSLWCHYNEYHQNSWL